MVYTHPVYSIQIGFLVDCIAPFFFFFFLQHINSVSLLEKQKRITMASTDIDSVIVQVPEANSPANSEASSSSSCSSTESDLDSVAAYSTTTTSGDIPDSAIMKDPEITNSPDVTQNHYDGLNGIVTLTTTTTSSTNSVSSPPPSDDPDEDDMQDLQGDESDVQGTIDAYAPEERMHSLSDPNSQITAVLQNSSATLWRQFDALGTEMIVTRRGR